MQKYHLRDVLMSMYTYIVFAVLFFVCWNHESHFATGRFTLGSTIIICSVCAIAHSAYDVSACNILVGLVECLCRRVQTGCVWVKNFFYSTMIDFTKPVRFSLTLYTYTLHSNNYSLVNIKWVYRHRNNESFAKMHSLFWYDTQKECDQFNPIKLYNQMEITNNNCRAKFQKANRPCVTQHNHPL